jgi:sugar phosphate isomerase/epimerase
MYRRTFLHSALAGAAGLATLAATGRAPAGEKAPFFEAHHLSLGLQLYTLNPDLTKDFDGTLAAVQRIGYKTVELPSFYGRTAAQLRQALDAHGLVCPSAHVQGMAMGSGPSLAGDLDALAADAHVIGITDVVMPILLFPANFKPPAGADMLGVLRAIGQAMHVADYEQMAEFLNDKGRKLHAHGIRVGYHNHNLELSPLADGSTGLEVLLRHTDARFVSFEMDAGWVAAAGLDPIALLKKHPGRFTQMHVKDIKPTTVANFGLQQDPTEVGSGKMDWRHILPVAYAAGVRRFYVEQEPPYPGTRLESVTKSYQYLTALVV